MSRVPSAGDVRVISVGGEQWLFDPQPRGHVGERASGSPSAEETRVIDVMLPDHEIFGMTLPPGTEHPEFTDDQLVSMALACLEMRRSESRNGESGNIAPSFRSESRSSSTLH